MSATATLAARGRVTDAALIAHLAEVDRRALFLAEGFHSLFEYCCGALRLSEHEAFNRIEAARLVRRLPRVLELLADGSVNLTTVRLLGPHLTADNHEAVLDAAAHKRKWQVEEIVARLAPRADVEATTQKVRASVAPLAPDRYELRCTVRRETRDGLRQAQDLLAHAAPGADYGDIVDRAVAMYVAQLVRQKAAVTARPRRTATRNADARRPSAEVRRQVWARDDGQCRFVGTHGRRCTATRRLEYHHVKPWEAFGPTSIENIELRCRAHNQLEADRFFATSRASRTQLVPERVDAARMHAP